LVGPTNPTWHLEMRDFLVNPQYEYCVDGSALYRSLDGMEHMTLTTAESTSEEDSASVSTVLTRAAMAKVLILYGSETGSAEAVARRLKRQLQLLKPQFMSLNEASGLEVVNRRGFSHVLCICSTFGKGEPPSNASKFFEAVIGSLSSDVKFAVLALGSTLYPDFCKAGTSLDRKLAKPASSVFASYRELMKPPARRASYHSGSTSWSTSFSLKALRMSLFPSAR